jgi:hypothetical protein
VTPEERLAAIVTALEAVGVSCLVMGGHAVRFYGLHRYTNDFDLHIAPDPWDDLAGRLAGCPLFQTAGVTEGPSWRAHAFKRFRIGALPDGADEWLEFWRENHLLAPHADLVARAQTGRYGGRQIAFLGLPDLIRSKETERDKDWDDVSRLEEFWDARQLASVRRGELALLTALTELRSRAGFGEHVLAGSFADPVPVAAALGQADHPVAQAFLIPFAPEAPCPNASSVPVEPVVVARLRQIAGGSPLHLSLVEVVRRRYVLFRKDADRKDKEAIRAGQTPADPS